MRPVALMLVVLCAIGLAACGGGERLTLEQYSDWCTGGIASAASLIDPERVTWGELQELASQSAEELRAVNPPRELSEFHRASLKTLDFVAEVAAEQDRDELANPLAFGLEAISIATQLRRSVDALSPQVHASLREAECL
ncbi:MAG: hypothetical protein OXH13_01495 [Chloroflexi bacterium]|nr:hypothetical protein [Chloroflexota bacterium]MCY3697308.1 hypothetical protein [Chloroflexota bacterium]